MNKRETGFEPATFALARRRSTPEPLAHDYLFTKYSLANKTNNTLVDSLCQPLFAFFSHGTQPWLAAAPDEGLHPDESPCTVLFILQDYFGASGALIQDKLI